MLYMNLFMTIFHLLTITIILLLYNGDLLIKLQVIIFLNQENKYQEIQNIEHLK